MFCLNTRFLSPRCYEYLRTKFDDNLPHSSTIRKWFSVSNVTGEGGFNQSALETLKSLSEDLKKDKMSLLVSISFDEMSIRRHVQWQHAKKKYSGFVNFFTKQSEHDPLPVATHALVAMLNGINMDITIPIAYFFITTLISQEKAILIGAILKALTDIGIRVVNFTFDGIKSNLGGAEIFGASFKMENTSPIIFNPDNQQRVFCILDPPHMIKLIRNCLGDEKTLKDKDGNRIEWKFIERLYRSKSNLASHKLTRKHIEWKDHAMNVRYAVQTLSNSVANSIDRLREAGVGAFYGSEGTTTFIKQCDKIFDVFNADKKVEGNIYKSPIAQESKQAIFQFLDDTVEYFSGITLNGKAIMTTNRFTPFVGFKGNYLENKI